MSRKLLDQFLKAAKEAGITHLSGPAVALIPCGSCKKRWICEERGCMDKARSAPAPFPTESPATPIGE